MQLDRPIFIVGAPRSGTTLVQCILSANSAAYSLPETHFFSIVLPGLGVDFDARLDAKQVARAESLITGDAEFPLTRTLSGTTPRALLMELLQAYREPEAHRVIEKTPLHVEYMPQIRAAFPDVKFVHVVRNPIDVVSSWLLVPWATTRSVISLAQAWSTRVKAGETHAPYTVVYEQLVQRPQAEVERLCGYVELDFQPAMLEEFGRQASRNVSSHESWKADVASGQILNRDQIWRERLTPGQAWLIERATVSQRAQFGYVDVAHASPASIAQALVHEIRLRFSESRAFNPLVSSLRHAATPVKLLLAPR